MAALLRSLMGAFIVPGDLHAHAARVAVSRASVNG